MWKTRALTIAVASLAIGGIATGFAAVRKDDRSAVRHDADAHAREARLTLPRTAAGAIDVPKLIVEIRAAMTRGARDIRFRDTALSANDVNTLRELAARFGFERVRIRDEGRGVRVEFRDRDELRGRVDERRDDDGRIRNDVRAERREDRAQRPEKLERLEKPERVEKADRPERRERSERGERPDRSGRH